jgi:hypothetical protein
MRGTLARATVLAVTTGALVTAAPAQAEPRADVGRHLVTTVGHEHAYGGELARGGVNKLSFHWWGVRVDLDSYWTKKLLAAINTGAGAAGIAAALAAAGVISSPGALPAGVAAGILAIGSGVIGFCSNDNGVSLYVTYNGMPWCGGQ